MPKKKRAYGQRTIHLSLPVKADQLLADYMKSNGCQSPTAVSLAIDRYGRLPGKPTPATLEKCGVIRADGKPCHWCKMPGQNTCSLHGAAYVERTVILPMEIQVQLDKFTAEHKESGATVNLVVALAIMTTME